MIEYPLPKFHFLVEWNNVPMNFTEITGLDKQVEVIEYREGQVLSFSKLKMPGLQKFSNITMKRGTYAGKKDFYDWLKEMDKLRNADRRDITVKLLDENHQPVMTWSILRAFPVKVQASDLKSDGNEVAIETIEVAHEGFKIM